MDVLTQVEQEGRTAISCSTRSAEVLACKERRGTCHRADLWHDLKTQHARLFLDKFVNKGVQKLQPWVRALLRISLYQVIYLDRIPDHAVVSEAVNLAKRRGHQGISGMVNGVLRNILRQKESLAIPENMPPAQRISLRHSHPLWLVERWISQYGIETAEAICAANNEPPAVSVSEHHDDQPRRYAGINGDQGFEVAPSPLSPYGIVVRGAGNMALTDWYRDGMISIQDESSMLVAEAVNPEPGMRVLDSLRPRAGRVPTWAS